MNEPHFIQMLILRELLFNPYSRFTDLNISGLTSDHFTYHVRTLTRKGYVRKERGKYILTAKGKEFSNQMNTDKVLIEKQPKVSVIVIVEKQIKGVNYFLAQTRLKEPFYSCRGFISGKVRFGETILRAARRELLEETGLIANLKFKFLLHEHVYSQKGNLLEDKLFHMVCASNPQGKLKDIKEGKNEWLSENQLLSSQKKFYDINDILKWLQKPPVNRIIEKSYIIKSF